MASLAGPHAVSSQLQVKLPTKLARALHMKPGDEYYWRHSDDDPDILQLVPSEVVERRYDYGERAEQTARGTAQQLPDPDEPRDSSLQLAQPPPPSL
ncbi:AbrB/MazE/SpoVT family DNA-binding domain-containing protein [Mycobacteroides abscessus]|uniref:AbrB/MazE/SpoVT family DNA-binding domain-containing protein n=1 Tax=Mycobacteroides abscessus TaxID=36809 RepID=UPI000C25A8CC|nr:AbrB/MazE/SpoVT family DNA-binding domain-containing protein [Mycobacteroides abscessus]